MTTNRIFKGITNLRIDLKELALNWWIDGSIDAPKGISELIELFFQFSGVDTIHAPGTLSDEELSALLQSEECVTELSPSLNPLHVPRFRKLLDIIFSACEYKLLLEESNPVIEKVKSCILQLIDGCWTSCRLTAAVVAMSLLTAIVDARLFLDESRGQSNEPIANQKRSLVSLHNWLKCHIVHRIPRDVSEKVRIIFIDEVKYWAVTYPAFALNERWKVMILWALHDDKMEIRLSALTAIRILIQSQEDQQRRRSLFNYFKKSLSRFLGNNNMADLVLKIFNAASRDFVSDIDDDTWLRIYKCLYSTDETVRQAAAELLLTTRLSSYTCTERFLKHLVILQMAVLKNEGPASKIMESFFDVLRETTTIDHWIDFLRLIVHNDRMDGPTVSVSLNMVLAYVRLINNMQSDSSSSVEGGGTHFFNDFTQKFPCEWFQLVKCDKVVMNTESSIFAAELISYCAESLDFNECVRVVNQLFKMSFDSNSYQLIRACFKSMKLLATKSNNENGIVAVIKEKGSLIFHDFVEYTHNYSSLASSESEIKIRLMEFTKVFKLDQYAWDTIYQIYRDLCGKQRWATTETHVFDALCDVLFCIIMVLYKEIIVQVRGLSESLVDSNFMVDECAQITSKVLDFQRPLVDLMRRDEHPRRAFFALADVLEYFGPFLVKHPLLWTSANAIHPDVVSLVVNSALEAFNKHSDFEEGRCCRIVKRVMTLFSNESVELIHFDKFLPQFGPQNEVHSLIVLNCLKSYSEITSRLRHRKLAIVIIDYFLSLLSLVGHQNSSQINIVIKKIKALIIWWNKNDPDRLSIHEDTLLIMHELLFDTAKTLQQERILRLIPCLYPLVRHADAIRLAPLLEAYKENEFVSSNVEQLQRFISSLSSSRRTRETN